MFTCFLHIFRDKITCKILVNMCIPCVICMYSVCILTCFPEFIQLFRTCRKLTEYTQEEHVEYMQNTC